MAVMIRYLCEYTAMDMWGDYARLTTRTKILVPDFPSAFRADPTRKSALNLFVDSWPMMKEMNPRLEIEMVGESRIFIDEDQPAAVARALADLSAARPN